MNRAKIVRADADAAGVMLRLWVEDQDGNHLAVAEMGIDEGTMITWARAITHEQNRAAQYMLRFDQ